ncbi:hypothetical protein M501DRAFT_917648, partial [Patellaria atrata CBS 101060]
DSQLPPYCEPANDFLHGFSSVFHTCVPTNLAFISTVLGTCSIISWLFAQVPQIYKNYKLGSTAGLSIFFLAEWFLGDFSNLLGSLFTGQALWQKIVAGYYCTVDVVLLGQWIWYELLKHGNPLVRIWRPGPGGPRIQDIDGMSITSSASTSTLAGVHHSESKPIQQLNSNSMFRTPRFSFTPSSWSSQGGEESNPSASNTPPTNRTIRRYGPQPQFLSSSPAASPKTILYIALLLSLAAPYTNASPLHSLSAAPRQASEEPGTEIAGRLLSWLSTLLYLGSRLPQLLKNHRRKSTAGLSPTLFIAAFFGNLFYSSSLLTNPNAWSSFPPTARNGSRGWVGRDGSDREEWVSKAAPFFLGAAGVLVMDAAVGFQFWYYGEVRETAVTVVKVRIEGHRSRWRRVSGWMRGWVPSPSVSVSNSEAPTPRPGSGAGKGKS